MALPLAAAGFVDRSGGGAGRAGLFDAPGGGARNARIALAPGQAALAAGARPIMDEDGFAIVAHEGPDDHMTQPIGGAGRASPAPRFGDDNRNAPTPPRATF